MALTILMHLRPARQLKHVTADCRHIEDTREMVALGVCAKACPSSPATRESPIISGPKMRSYGQMSIEQGCMYPEMDMSALEQGVGDQSYPQDHSVGFVQSKPWCDPHTQDTIMPHLTWRIAG